MSHFLGAIDGKHIAKKKPAHSGSLWHNCKGYFSMVLLAICDAHHNVTAIDNGKYGSNNDCGVLLNSRMGTKFGQNCFNIPPPETLDGFDEMVPFFLFGDEIFPLKKSLTHPFAGKQLTDEIMKVFSYRLSTARRIIENTFRILVLSWRVFQKPIEGKPELVEKIALAATALHNYLQQTDNAHYTPAGFVHSEDKSGTIIEGQWRKLIDSNLQSLRPIRKSRYPKNALQVREILAYFFVLKNGSVSWQWDHIRRTGN